MVVYGYFIFLFLVAFVCLIIGLIKPSIFNRVFRREMNRKKNFYIFGIAFVVFFIIAMVTTPPEVPATPTTQTNASAENKTASSNSKNNQPAPAANLPALNGSVVFRIESPDQGDGLIINNDQGNVGTITITNNDNFTWKNCTVSRFAPGSEDEQTLEQLSQMSGGHESPYMVGDVNVGDNFKIMATDLGFKEDDFRILPALALVCDNGQATIGDETVGAHDTIAWRFNSIAPLKTTINN